MFKHLLSVWLFGCLAFALSAVQTTHDAEQIARAIAPEIQTGLPVFLDLQCGDWTTALSQQLTAQLLARGADLRIDLSSLATEVALPDSAASGIRLSDYGLDSALLVQVSLNLKWQEVVQRNFFSYRSERHPIYSFETRQIQLPEQKILKISSYDFDPPKAAEKDRPQLRMRWFEPLVAAAAIGSMIFLLWNFD